MTRVIVDSGAAKCNPFKPNRPKREQFSPDHRKAIHASIDETA